MIIKYSEDDLRNDFIKYLKEQGYEDIGTEINTGYNANFVDCVYVDKRRRFVCVELKLKNISVVIKQAVKLLRYTPLVYVALPVPKRKETRKRWETLVKRLKLGLYWLTENGVWMTCLTPKENRYLWGKELMLYNQQYLKKSFYHTMHITFLNKCVEYKE